MQGRTYANMFGLVERFINAKVLEVSQRHVFGDQTALEALVRFSDEELKHQELFRRIEALAAQRHAGVATRSCSTRTRSLPRRAREVDVVGARADVPHRALHADPLQGEHRAGRARCRRCSRTYSDFHWMEESQHAVLDELEWRAEDAKLEAEERDRACPDLIDLVAAVDGILANAGAPRRVVLHRERGRVFAAPQQARIEATFLSAYRYQYILSGVQSTRFAEILRSLVDEAQFARVVAALETLS